jgi:hypothetical protein
MKNEWIEGRGMPFKKGRVKTGGRKKGIRTKRREEADARVRQLISQEVQFTPLQVMMVCMQARIEVGDYDGALVAAEKAAPYCHAKLAMSEVKVQHSTNRSDSDIAAEKLDAARSLPAPPIIIDITAEPAAELLPEPVSVEPTC